MSGKHTRNMFGRRIKRLNQWFESSRMATAVGVVVATSVGTLATHYLLGDESTPSDDRMQGDVTVAVDDPPQLSGLTERLLTLEGKIASHDALPYVEGRVRLPEGDCVTNPLWTYGEQ